MLAKGNSTMVSFIENGQINTIYKYGTVNAYQ